MAHARVLSEHRKERLYRGTQGNYAQALAEFFQLM
jgi:hypothetical protein